MKKYIIILILTHCAFTVGNAQEVNYNAHADTPHYLYVGNLQKTSTSTLAKLKVEIFGGSYWSNLATTTYSIATRDGYHISTERRGGGGDNFSLEVYDNGGSFDFVLKITRFAMLNIKVTHAVGVLNTISQQIPVPIKKYDVTNKINMTNLFSQIISTATDINNNIGIGTLTPRAKLDVRGKIIADEVQIKVNTGADFVFEPYYELTPLSELKTFITKNKHLPEIPSEKEMIENGVSVNEMQIKLLQKIEELTLYVIEQDQKYNELKEELNNLKK